MSVKKNTIIPLKLWQEKICKNPNILISEEPWNHFDEIIPCGKCIVCKKNIKRMEKM